MTKKEFFQLLDTTDPTVHTFVSRKYFPHEVVLEAFVPSRPANMDFTLQGIRHANVDVSVWSRRFDEAEAKFNRWLTEWRNQRDQTLGYWNLITKGVSYDSA